MLKLEERNMIEALIRSSFAFKWFIYAYVSGIYGGWLLQNFPM